MKVLIVEDEDLAAVTLQNALLRINPAVQVAAILGTVEAAAAWLTNNTPDLIFMDIHLGDGESFRIFQLVTIECPVIFTTAYDQYTLKAFKHQGIDYLLKPFNEADIRGALNKLEMLRRSATATDTVQSSRHPDASPAEQAALTSPAPFSGTPAIRLRNRFLVKIGRIIKTIALEEVAYFMASDKYLFMITKDQQHYIIEETIASLEPQLNPELFFRINRKFIIQVKAIKEMHKLPRNRVKVVLSPPPPENVEIVVSEERAEDFKQWLDT
ncbi:LytR/AlgR family response regulator transcription factor [Filimonas effusa]|uniref:Response regulator transcription factor n=1 Tax=Filimonas effusa TaxID=2508721 RepID=A0A4Q1D5K9_9BACT|nr:LytTR family DNA-binding domain-containing protein [Filimonas effusa]RXK83678.1 response regulator transcription factor [Filimonas effusa]